MWKEEEFKKRFTEIIEEGAFRYAWVTGVLSELIKNKDFDNAEKVVKWIDEIEKE